MKRFLRAFRSYWLIILIAVLLLGGVAGYFAGYRVDQVGITRVGTLTLTGLPEKTAVYIDASRRVRAANGQAKLAFTPGSHSVIVDSVGNEPWNEIFTIGPAQNISLAPILVPTAVKASALSGADKAKALALMRTPALPTKAKPLARADGCALVYVSGSRIIAEGTTTPSCAPPPYLVCAEASAENPTGACAPTIIYATNGPVRAVLPYPGRSDTLVVAAGNLAFVLELDPREPQFFAPIFKGPITGAASWSARSVVVTDGSTVAELPL